MRFSSTLAVALGVTPLVAALPSGPLRPSPNLSASGCDGAACTRILQHDYNLANRKPITRSRARRQAYRAMRTRDDDSDDSGDESDSGTKGRQNKGARPATPAPPAAAPAPTPAPAPDAGTGAGREEGKEDNDVAGTFGTLIDLPGGDKQQDTKFKTTVGQFEVEFKAKTARKFGVLENKKPGAPPAGFKLVNPSSFLVAFQGGGGDLTLGQIDFIYDTANPALQGIDLAKTTVGKFNDATSIFEVGAAIGETEFEADEGEIVLKVKNLVGEWAIFVPDSTAAGLANSTALRGAPRSDFPDGVARRWL